MIQDEQRDVARRRVFYIPGFDPFPPRRYRELYRRESARQGEISGYRVDVTTPQGVTNSWETTLRQKAHESRARISVLTWSDIVQASMRGGVGAVYGQLARTVWAYLGSGALFRLARLRRGPLLAALYPIVVLLVQLALALLVARIAGAALFALSGMRGAGWGGLVLIWPVLALFRRLDGPVMAHYLMHDYAYVAQSGGATPPALEARIADFADQVAAALAEDWDEVLVVGHSSGAHIAISVLAAALRGDTLAADWPARGPKLALLTLGQVVPMVSFLPGARALRRDLAELSVDPRLFWLDISAPGDPAAFALCDPVAVSAVAPPGKRWPLVLSAAYSQTLSPAAWAAIRWRFFRRHIQYLCAFDRPGAYDYFQITAGAHSLARRFGARAPSASRIETPLNPHRSLA